MFADQQHAWIAGSGPGGDGFVLASDDGGASWQRVFPSHAPMPAVAVSFVSPTTGFGLGTLGDGRATLQTDDGGATWRTVGRLPADPAAPDVDPVLWFVDPTHGWVVAQGGVLLATSDGGASWSGVTGALPPAPGPQPDGVAFADPLHGCAGNLNVAVGTRDGGRTWQPADASHGVLACAATLLDPRWAQLGSALFGPGHDLSLDAVLPDGVAVAQGFLDDGLLATVVSRDGGATWTAERWPAEPNALGIEALVQVSFVSASDGWELGLLGRLYRTTDGGASWQEVGPG